MTELQRANKVTAYWEGEGVAVAIFYKTHDKIATVKSTDDAVVAAGFKFPEDTEENKTTATKKLELFKTFAATNASAFGIQYDPVDRRADEYKFPGSYTKDTISDNAKKMLDMQLKKVLNSVQTNVVDKMVKAGHLAEGAQVQYGIGEGTTTVTEQYSNENLKYATVEFPIAIAVAGKQADENVSVELVSGQLKKPRQIGNTVLTMSGIKAMLIEKGVLPKIEKPVKEEKADDVEPATKEQK